MTRRIYYKSDFDFVMKIFDEDGIEIGFPDFDWSAKVWTDMKSNALTVGCRGGEQTNCFNDGGQIHVVAQNHGLGTGLLKAELTAWMDDKIYDGGKRKDVSVADLDIELTRDKDAGGLTVEGKNERSWRRKWMAGREVPITVHTPKFHDPWNSRWYAVRLDKYGSFYATMATGGEEKLRKRGGSIEVTIPNIDWCAKILNAKLIDNENLVDVILAVKKSENKPDTYTITNNAGDYPPNIILSVVRFNCKPIDPADLNTQPYRAIKVGFVGGRLQLRGLGSAEAQRVRMDRPRLNKEKKVELLIGMTVRSMFETAFAMTNEERFRLQIRQRTKIKRSYPKHSSYAYVGWWAGCAWRPISINKTFIGVFRLRYKQNVLNASDWTYVSVLKLKGESTILIKEIK